MIKSILLCLLLIQPIMASAQDSFCILNKNVVGDCWEIRGRLQVYNGTPNLRIWPVGTKRLLGVVPSEAEIIPEHLRAKIKLSSKIFANFEVCPFTKFFPGQMQMVCIESAKNIRIESN